MRQSVEVLTRTTDAFGVISKRTFTIAGSSMEEISRSANEARQAIANMRDPCSPLTASVLRSVATSKVGFAQLAASGKLMFATINANAQMEIKAMDLAVSNFLDNTKAKIAQVLASLGGFGSEVKKGVSGAVQNALGSTIGKFTIAGVAANAVTSLATSLASVPSTLTAQADEYASIQARLALVTNSQAEAVQLNNSIYQSALKARGSYSLMADSVSKIAMTAKEAFPDARAVAPFVEGIQKLFVVGGTGTQQQGDAMLQLTQALGSGKLQGDEFRSIAEAAPLIEQMVAKQMGVTQGELKALSSEGKITADIIRDAILGNMDEINAKFEQMPKKWTDGLTEIKTKAVNAFAPVFSEVSKLANSDVLVGITNGIVRGIEIAAYVLLGLINNAKWLGSVLYSVGAYVGSWFMAGFTILQQGFSVVAQYASYFFGAVVMGMGLYLAYLAATRIQVTAWMMEEAAKNIIAGMSNAVMAVKNALLAIYNARTIVATGVTKAWALATKAQAVAMRILNAVIKANPIGFIISLVVMAIAAFGAWAVASQGVRSSLVTVFRAIAGVAADAINFIIECINDGIDAINKLASGINGVFNTKIGVIGKIEYRANKADWENAGEDLANTVVDMDFGKIMGGIPSAPEAETFDYTDILGQDVKGADAKDSKSGRKTAGNTGKMVDALDDLEDDMKDWRVIAEQEAINYYTNKDYKISVGDINNSINKPADVDGVISSITRYLREGMSAGAEAVHA